MTQATELYDKWIRAWNGEMDLIDEIISPDFHFHPTNEESGEDYSGRDGVRKMITSSRTLFTPITFSIGSSKATCLQPDGSAKANTLEVFQAQQQNQEPGSASRQSTSYDSRTVSSLNTGTMPTT